MPLPSNIRTFLKDRSEEQRRAANKVCKWCEELGHYIVGGTAIGKYYDTLILDLTHYGQQIRIDEDGTIEINDVKVRNKQDAKVQIEKILNKTASKRRVARELARIAMELVAKEVDPDDEQQLKKDIEKLKQVIIRQVKRKGVYENLGQKEVRQLRDKYNSYKSNIGRLIGQFEDWCETYEG